MAKFDDVQPGVITPPAPVEIEQPVRSQSRESDILVPFLDGLIPAGLLTVAEAGTLFLLWPGLDIKIIGIAAIWTFVPIALWRYHVAVQVARESLWKRESYSGADLNGDGIIGAPAHFVITNAPPKATETDAEQYHRHLLAFVEACYRVKTPSTRTLRGEGFSEADTSRYRDVLMRLGIAEWNNRKHQQLGWQMVVPQSEALSKAQHGAFALPNRGRGAQ